MAEWLCCSKKKSLSNHKCCGLGFYSLCCILFLTCKSPKSQSPHGVLTESLISPSGTVRGLLGESPLYGDYIGSPSGLLGDSLRTPWGLPSNMWLSVTTSPSARSDQEPVQQR